MFCVCSSFFFSFFFFTEHTSVFFSPLNWSLKAFTLPHLLPTSNHSSRSQEGQSLLGLLFAGVRVCLCIWVCVECVRVCVAWCHSQCLRLVEANLRSAVATDAAETLSRWAALDTFSVEASLDYLDQVSFPSSPYLYISVLLYSVYFVLLLLLVVVVLLIVNTIIIMTEFYYL